MINALFAFFISLTAPGAGQFFNGEFLKAAFFLCFFIFGKTVFLPLLIRIFDFKDQLKTLRLIYIFNTLYPVIMIIAAIDAAVISFGVNNTNPMWFVYTLIITAISVSAYRNLKSPFIISALSGREDTAKYLFGTKTKNN